MLTVELPIDLHREVRVHAAHAGITIREFTMAAIRDRLEQHTHA